MENIYKRRYLSTESNRQYIRYILQLRTMIYILNNHNSGCVQKFPFTIELQNRLSATRSIHSQEAF